MRREVIELFDYLGLSPKYLGYKYLTDAAVMCIESTMDKKEITVKSLFTQVAYKYNTHYMHVDKDSRTCIEGLFIKGNLDRINEIFQSVSTYYVDKPSNKLFLKTIVSKIVNNNMDN